MKVQINIKHDSLDDQLVESRGLVDGAVEDVGSVFVEDDALPHHVFRPVNLDHRDQHQDQTHQLAHFRSSEQRAKVA